MLIGTFLVGALSAETSSVKHNGGKVDEVNISVTDTGPGISEADRQIVFEKFHQLDKSLTKGSSGAGLGLAIAKE